MILGLISIISMSAAVFFSYRSGGEVAVGYGVAGLLAFLYSAVGLVLGIVTALNKNYYKAVPVAGILLNLASLGCLGLILYMGGYFG